MRGYILDYDTVLFRRISGRLALLVCIFLSSTTASWGNDVRIATALEKARRTIADNQYDEAIKQARRAYNLAKKAFAENDPIRIDAQLLLANALQNIGSIVQAEPIYRHAVQMLRQSNKADEKVLADALGRLGTLYLDAGRPQISESALKRSVQITKKVYGPGHVKLAVALIRQAERDFSQRLFGYAASRLTEAKTILEKSPAKKQSIHARLLINIGLMRLNRSRNNRHSFYFLSGGSDFKEALRLIKNMPNPDVPLQIKALSGLAAQFRTEWGSDKLKGYHESAKRNFNDSKEYHQRALSLAEEYYGSNHPKYAEAVMDFAFLHYLGDNYLVAVKKYEKAFEILRRAFPGGHYMINDNSLHFANAYRGAGNRVKAETLWAEAKTLPTSFEQNTQLAFATTRAWNKQEQMYELGSGSDLTFGIASIRVAEDPFIRRAGILADPDRWFAKGYRVLSFSGDFRVFKYSPSSFLGAVQTVRSNLRKVWRFPDQALVFVHGFNVDLKEALRRAAQIAFDLEFDGVLMVYSWSSAGSTLGYISDRSRAELAAKPFLSFLDQMSQSFPKMTIHVLAHSMGNRLLSRSMEMLAKRPKSARLPRLGEIIMAHADIDLNWCRKMGEVLPYVRGVTNYVNADDWALWVSKNIRLGEDRCGSVAQSYPGVQTIDTTGMGGLGSFKQLVSEKENHHDVFVNDPVLFGDIHQLIASGKRPVHKRTPAFRAARVPSKPVYWKFDRKHSNYPHHK